MNQCEAIKILYLERKERCRVAARVDINKKKLCLRHAQQEALSLAFTMNKAKEIIIPQIVKDIKIPVEIFKPTKEKDE